MKKYVFGTSPLGPSRKVKAAVRKAAKAVNSPNEEEAERLCRLFLSKYGIGRESLAFANSINEIYHAVLLCLKPKKVLVAGPAQIVSGIASAGAEVEVVSSMDGGMFQPDLGKLTEKAVGADVVFMANPNMISGRIISASAMNELAAVIGLNECRLVIDESLMDFTGEEGLIKRAARSKRMIVLRTNALFHGLPGLGLAYAVSSSEIIGSMKKYIFGEVNTPALAAAKEAFRDRTFCRLSGQFIAAEKRLLSRKLGSLTGVTMYDSDSNVFLVNAGLHAARVLESCTREGLSVCSCRDIDGLDETYLMVSVMGHDHNLKLARIIRSICSGDASEMAGGPED